LGILVLEGSWVDQLYVEPAMTGQGIGADLLRVAKRERPLGLRLWTFASNTRAQRFYERQGFVEVRRTDGRDNEEKAPDILYVWAARRRPVRTSRSSSDAPFRFPRNAQAGWVVLKLAEQGSFAYAGLGFRREARRSCVVPCRCSR
jgi:hypothetical protein